MLKKAQGKEQMNVDRISNLPWDVLDSILVHMPLKEAVRTSVLSRKWRRQWTRLSQFLITDKIFPGATLDKHARWREIANILRQVHHHNTGGPIEKFKLAAYCCPDHSALLQWLGFLFAKKGLKEFVLQDFVSPKRLDFPLHAFSCRQLARLDLFGCTVRLPEGCDFEGFGSLTSLKLTAVCIDSETLPCLISKCPALESLTLLQLDHSIFLRLHCTKLRYLKISSAFEDICLLENPSLGIVDVRMRVPVVSYSRHEGSSLVRIVGCLEGVKRLALTNEFIEFLGKRGVPERLPSPLENLNVLELREVRADNLKHVKVALCLLKSAPNLEELYISVGRSTGSLKTVFDFLSAQSDVGLYFSRLKVVKVTGIWDFTLAEYFFGLILAHSPILETLTIIHYDGESLPDQLFKDYDCASEHVKIVTLISAS